MSEENSCEYKGTKESVIYDRRIFHGKYELEFEQGQRFRQRDFLFNHIAWAPRKWLQIDSLETQLN